MFFADDLRFVHFQPPGKTDIITQEMRREGE